MNYKDRITFQWHGAAHHHISYNNMKIIVDPLYTRLRGDIPHLEVTKEDVQKIDYLLLTHGHLDHSMDFPYLLAKHNPEAYAPEEYLNDIQRGKAHSDLEFDLSKCHSLEKVKGKTFRISEIEVTPYQIGTEEIDFWFIRSMCIRPWLHLKPRVIPFGLKWLRHHLFCNCFAYLFRFPPDGDTMLYFGNLTDKVEELEKIDRVHTLAIPYCPANNKWLRQSQYLITRFKPNVTMIHHFDNFMHPYTLSKYLNLNNYRNAICEKCPDVKLYFSKFSKIVDYDDISNA
jgi:phosphoribosyl 1,2-cyclic phosphodiesterase